MLLLPVVKRLFRAFLIWVFLIALMLSAWGWNRISGFRDELPRFLLPLVWLILSLYGAWNDTQTSGSRGRNEVRRHRKVFLFLLPIFVLWFFYLPYSDHDSDDTFSCTTLRWVGLGLFAGSLLLRIEAIRAQGKQFSCAVAIQDGHQLTLQGPYRWIRHPAYLGVIGMFWGISWVFARIELGLFMALLVWLWMESRIRDEEKLLLQEFGQAYASYRQKTAKLLPLVY
jgi:protein-S-isoprenylcysteine O-methyltransferase Ste14